MRHVVFYKPGDRDIPLLAECRRRGDVRVLGVVDPTGDAPGTALAEVMGLHVAADLARLMPPPDAWVVSSNPGALHADGLRIVETADLLTCLDAPPAPDPITPPPVVVNVPPPTPDRLTAALRVLERIAESLDPERLPARLLAVAMEAVGADGGSLMLLDRRAEQLYIAAAHGLDDRILHGTRQPLGAGISGRVARTGQAERIVETPEKTASRERGGITSALCTPLTSDSVRLGVLNVNTTAPSSPFPDSALDALRMLGDEVARILAGSALADPCIGSPFEALERAFRELDTDDASPGTILSAWASTLAMSLSAEHASLALVREDGSLLLSEGTASGEVRTGSVPQQHPAWDDVLRSGRPVLVRPELDPATRGGITMFFLPVGHDPVRAILAVRFPDPAAAHNFQLRADGVLTFLEDRLAELRRRHAEALRARRLGDLAAFLAETPPLASAPDRRHAIRDFLARTLGAETVVFAGSPADTPPEMHTLARDLLARVDDAGWLVTTVAPGSCDDTARTCLAVHVPGRDAVTGWVLLGKRPLDDLDGAAYTPFDAQLVQRLASLVPEDPPIVATSPRPEGDALLSSLSREIDRADRYHVAFSLTVFETGRAGLPAASLLAPVSAGLRASDLLFPGEDGRLFVIAPEETQAVAHMERRALHALREAADDPDLPVRAGHALYPGADDTPEALVHAALAHLANRPRDGD